MSTVTLRIAADKAGASENIGAVKRDLQGMGETGAQAVVSLLGTLPDCTVIQMAQITANALTNGQIEFCNPPITKKSLILTGAACKKLM